MGNFLRPCSRRSPAPASCAGLGWAGRCRNWSFCGLLVCDLQLVADLSQPSPASSPTQVRKLGPTGDPSNTFHILYTEFGFWECGYLLRSIGPSWHIALFSTNANNEDRRWTWAWAGSRETSRRWELWPAARADIIHTWPGLNKTKKHNLTFPWHRDVLPLLLWGLPACRLMEGEKTDIVQKWFFVSIFTLNPICSKLGIIVSNSSWDNGIIVVSMSIQRYIVVAQTQRYIIHHIFSNCKQSFDIL